MITVVIIVQLAALFILGKAVAAKADLLVQQKHKLTAFEQKESSFVQLQEDYNFLKDDINIIDEALPNKEKIVDFLNQLEKEASASGVSAEIGFANQSINTEPSGIRSVAFNLSLKGTYFEMVRFIREIEKMPQVVSIERISIQSPEGIETKNNVILHLKCYIDPNF